MPPPASGEGSFSERGGVSGAWCFVDGWSVDMEVRAGSMRSEGKELELPMGMVELGSLG